ncbi:MAG: ATP-dependent DNA helicase RecG [bacterium]|nr:ATP-dependent DNA helicase RecG [bacterium]
MNLKTPIGQAGRLYKMYARRLEKLGIFTLEDFLFHIPFRYENYSLISKIRQVQPGEIVTIIGKVVEIKNEYTKKGKKLQRAKIQDETGTIDAIWFNQPFLIRVIKNGDKIALAGEIKIFNKLILESPQYEIIYSEGDLIHTGRIVPIYPETKGISSKWIRRQIYKMLRNNEFEEYLPESIIADNDFPPLKTAFEQTHFPDNFELAEKAKKRLAFDELFLMQLAALFRRSQWEKNFEGQPFSITKFKTNIKQFCEKLPFELTGAQKKAVKEILEDLAGKKPMNRLLEGDVGSGKTVVSAAAMYLAFLNGFQSVLMTPTEILAQQHYQTISNLLSPFGVKVDLITGNKKLQIKNCKLKILVGTHALLNEKLKFERLGLVIIDEQQRFGVEQRALIKQKGKNPHLLTMTATPIPRTIALTMYGDLDLSYLDEMPKGRKTIKTWLVPAEKREGAYEWIKKEINENKSQVFLICPFIEESETMQTVKAATKEFERLKKGVFKNQKMGLLHGKLKSKEKDEILQKFKNKEFDILVATPVVEVGIDIPNATIILIEGAERFGLSQLHQLRGRVGRGNKQSYCLIFTEAKNPLTVKRLKAMEKMHSGAELAELDLRLRGPGEMYGTVQHGIPQLKVASFSDFGLIEKARSEAEKIFPKLSNHLVLKEKMEQINIKQISPD